MFEGLRAKRAENRVRIQYAKVEERQAEIAFNMLNENRFKKSLEDKDEAEWIQIGKDSDKALTEEDQANLREQAIKYYYRNPWGKNIIRLFEKYVVGRGFQIMPQSTMPQLQKYWDDFWRVNNMEKRKKEIVRRAMRDGECFIRFFKKLEMLVLRFMNPAKVKEPDEKKKSEIKGNASFGIETNREDIEEVYAYWYNGDRISADEVYHVKIMVDSDVKRGRSFIEAAADYIAMYRKWLKDRMKLNMIRAIMGLLKKVSGSPTDAAAIASGYDTSKNKAPDGSYYHRAPEGVSVFTTTKGVEYEFMTPNLQAADVQKDGRAVLLAICTAAGIPEFMGTSDASNSSYASTMVAEGPAVMEFEDWQDFFAIVFCDIYAKAIETGINSKQIPEYEMVMMEMPLKDEKGNPILDEQGNEQMAEQAVRQKTSTECTIVFPDIVTRKIKEETDALVLQSNQNWISDHTASARLDLDYEEEQEWIEKENEEETGGEENIDDHSEEEYDLLRQEETGTKPVEKEKPEKSE